MKILAPLLIPALILSPLAQFGAAAPVGKGVPPPPPGGPADPGWPREIMRDGIKLTVYQPQLDEWKDYRELKARIAFVLTPKDGKPVVGIGNLEGATTANVAERTVLIRDLKIASARFPSLPDAETGPMEGLLKKTFPGRSLTVSLDRLAAGVERGKAAKPLDLKMDPPKIFVSARPAVLLTVEGKPVKAPIAGTKLEFVVNTNWDLLYDGGSESYFLLADTAWLTATKLDGEWNLAASLPPDFARLPKGDQWDHVKKTVPPKIDRGMVIPAVYYSEQPAELIAFDGNPTWEEVEDTGLLWGKNTESWVFEDTKDRQIYFLVSGRWFRAAKWEGPWTYAGNDLPEDFKKIPPDSACADVLASVPGTPEAEDAVLLAGVPQEAVVKKAEAEKKAKVAYDGGQPQFAPIEGTPMSYATNTSSDVIQVEREYYLCQDAVWFVSATPVGPWRICVTVPGVIYTIPPAYPVHRVTYVKIEAGESDDVVVCNYTEGYFGAFVAGAATTAALVWGTGWYYPPYVAWGGSVPIYRPWPATYGVAAAYNPWTGGYAVGGRVYGPYASAGRAAWYNPATGNYGRAARVEGPYGARTVAAGYNPRTDTGWATRQGNNGYAQWGTSAVRRGDDWVRAGHVATDDGGAARWRGSEGGGRVWKTDDHSGGAAVHDGNFYAGHDGNVYRRDDDGNWAKWDDGGWDSVDKKDDLRDSRNRYDRPDANPSRPDAGNRPNPANRPDAPTRPGQDGGGEQKFKPGEFSRPGQGGGGVQKIKPGEFQRPGQDGGGVQRFDRDSIANRQTARRAEQQPSDDIMKQLNHESFNRGRSDFHERQERSFQPQPHSFEPQRRSGGSAPHFDGGASVGSRSFGGGGGHSFHGGGGGLRRR